MEGNSRKQVDSQRLVGIESLRCVAATLIILFHMADLPGIAIPPALNVIGTHFALSVPLFYTLSGFVLSFGYLDALETREQAIGFYVRRYFRIAPLFYAMLLIWILVGCHRRSPWVPFPAESPEPGPHA